MTEAAPQATNHTRYRIFELPDAIRGLFTLLVVIWVAGTLFTVTQTDLHVKICMNGSRSRGVGYRVLLY